MLIYNRASEISRLIEQDHGLFSGEHNLAVSVVSVAEVKSILYRSGVGERRVKRLEEKLNKLVKLRIDQAEILDRYIEIDAFSQGQHKTMPSDFTARNMGKNDLWIAATASALDLKLVTTDRDFTHLDGKFIEIQYIDLQHYRNQALAEKGSDK